MTTRKEIDPDVASARNFELLHEQFKTAPAIDEALRDKLLERELKRRNVSGFAFLSRTTKELQERFKVGVTKQLCYLLRDGATVNVLLLYANDVDEAYNELSARGYHEADETSKLPMIFGSLHREHL